MSRTLRARWARACALALALGAAGCQNYNFNPVRQCVIQPGTKRVTLSNVSSADVLFVVDDSGSMAAEQARLATNFDVFIGNLDAANAARAEAELEPFDFHISVTSTSVYWNFQTDAKPGGPYVCSTSCGPAAGRAVCCRTDGTNQPARAAVACTPGTTTCPAGTACGANCQGLKGENYCCNQADGSFPVGSVTAEIPCTRVGTVSDPLECGTFERHYDFSGTCVPGVAVDEWPYPAGDFVSWTSGGTANPRVLHFDKELYTGTANRQGFTRAELISFFGDNVSVGTCGSGQEQALQAARLAVQKAAAGQQRDTYARTGAPAPQTWTPATRTAGSTADFLAPERKLVLVFVGDEDDCSAPADPSGGVVFLAQLGEDACQRDASTGAPLGQKQYTVAEIADYFMGLGRPVGAAFILPAAQNSCSGDTCTAGLCCGDCPVSGGVCQRNATCGAQAAGHRLIAAASEFRNRGADVVVGSICDNFGPLLDGIAELVKPPSGLTLPSLPAEEEVTLLRIADAAGQTRKMCGRPMPPGSFASMLAAQGQLDPDTGRPYDWWFTASPNVTEPGAWNPVAVSQHVYINPKGGCIANPGETYSADYLAKLPSGGCWDDAAYTRQTYVDAGGASQTETHGDAMCRSILGGAAGSWTCYAGVDTGNACVAPTAGATGTCICGSRSDNCPSPTP